MLQPHHHPGDGLGALPRVGQRRRDQRRRPEIGAVRQAGHEAGEDQEAEMICDGRQGVADRKEGQQTDDQCASRGASGDRSDDRCPDHHADGIGADEMAGGRHARVVSRAMSGSNPIETNSEVPMANAPSTRAHSAANFSRAGLRLESWRSACTSAVISAPLVLELEGTGARCGSE